MSHPIFEKVFREAPYLFRFFLRLLLTLDVKDRFERITDNHGWSAANRAMLLMRSLYRKPCADIEALHNPVIRDALWLAMFTGLLREEVLTFNWEHVDRQARTFRVRHARGALSSELPISTQLAAILDRRHAECRPPRTGRRAWVFPSQTSSSGHLRETKHLYARLSQTVGVKFWFQGIRNCYLAVAERDLLLPSSLTSRLLNRAPVGGIATGHPDDWTIDQLREPAQRIANKIEELMNAPA